MLSASSIRSPSKTPNSLRLTFFSVALFTTLLISGLTLSGRAGAEQVVQQESSLYQRLGGLAPIAVEADDFFELLVPDPILNTNPAIDAARKRVPAAYLKYRVTSQVCQVTGGPCTYTGRDMKSTHAALNISAGEWQRMLTLFKQVLANHQVPARETRELLDIMASTRADIVMPGQ